MNRSSGRTCILPSCSSTYKNSRAEKLSFHAFPTNEDAKSKWLKTLGLSAVPKTAYVCSLHFADDCYHGRFLDQKRYLVRDAVPTHEGGHGNKYSLESVDCTGQTIPCPPGIAKDNSSLNIEATVSAFRDTARSHNFDREISPGIDQATAALTSDFVSSYSEDSMGNNNARETKHEKQCCEEVQILRGKLENARAKLRQKTSLYNHMLKSKNKIIRELKRKCSKMVDQSVLRKIFTETQLNVIKTGKSRPGKWSSLDFTRAIPLKIMSSKGYEYARQNLGLPLPSSSRMRMWSSNYRASLESWLIYCD